MKMLYLFLSLFACQLYLTTPSGIVKGLAENSLKESLSKYAPESTIPNIPPFLIVKDREDPDANPDRAKRDIEPKKADEGNGCRREPFIVHTKDLGLSTKFIRPERFNAYQCKGKCSSTREEKFVSHSLLKTYVKKMKGVETDGEACCVPTKLRPMSFLYYTDKHGSFVMQTFEDLVVAECGCY